MSTPEIQLEYGIQDGKLISIADIPEDQKGLRCKCVCPGCGGVLVARLGKKRRHHFVHHGTICNLEHAQQTILHMLAKEIIAEEKQIVLPGYSVEFEEIRQQDYIRKTPNMPKALEYRKAAKVKCSSVTLEKKISTFVPDIVVDIQGRICLIEIAVTHFVDEEKKEKIVNAGLPTVEIDLSSFAGQAFTREAIRSVLLSNSNHKQWIYNPLREEALLWARAEYDKLYEVGLAQEAAEQRKREKLLEEERQARIRRKQKREDGEHLLQELLKPENYKAELLRLRSERAFRSVGERLHLRREIAEEIPFFLDIPITGEMVFACDRRIWQAAIFDKFIYYRQTDMENPTYYSIAKVIACLRDYTPFVPINWSLTYRTTVKMGRKDKTFTLFQDVVRRYFKYLHYLGFVDEMYYGEGRVLETNSVIPPNGNNAKILKSALERVDIYDPNVDDLIDRAIMCLSF